jgi:hypothetical protein
LFTLIRHEDETGVSGTGTVAEGVEFTDGTCVIRWLTATSSTGIYHSIKEVEILHGHNGRTTVEWLDGEDGLG